MSDRGSILIATRGSALALAQANLVIAQCRQYFPDLRFDLKIIKTTGDKLQTINLANPNQEVTKGLFTKELEVALLNGEADFAVHSLKDLPTELPSGLQLAGVSEREDPRDVLIYRAESRSSPGRGFKPGTRLEQLPPAAIVATSSTRRQAQLLAARPDIKTIPIRGNVGTRLQKLLDQPELDAIILALAGLKRLGYAISASGRLERKEANGEFFATILPVDLMIPCVGQAALGYENRVGDDRIGRICEQLNHKPTLQCVTAERAFLNAMGGGCLSPVAAFADIEYNQLRIRAISFRHERMRRGELFGPPEKSADLGRRLAEQLGL